MTAQSRRVIVFVDVQNIHEGLKVAFSVPPHKFTAGQFQPMGLGRLLISKAPAAEAWQLREVRLYAGRPSSVLQPGSAAAHARQASAWAAAGATVRARDLQYIDWPNRAPRQKGVDVELATDVFRLAGTGYDIGIVASLDTDIIPAIEAVYEARAMADTPRICVVGYEGSPRRLRLADSRGRGLYCFYISAADYAEIHDPTDYTKPSI